MNTSLLNTTLTLAFAAVSFSMSSAAFAGPGETTDQVTASFDRLLKPTSTKTAAVPQPTATFRADPLMASVNSVLWQKPSYHLPTQIAFFSERQKVKQ